MAQKGKTKLRDLGRRKSKKEIQERVQKAASGKITRVDKELRLLQKAANERMRQLEKRGINSPAYQAVQAQLEILGKRTKGERGRRFSETGRGTYADIELQKKMLREFLAAKTSKVKGAKDYENSVWNTANENMKLDAAGITRKQWLDFWAAMPDRKDRLYGSEQIVSIVRAYSIKNGKLKDKDRMSVEEIAAEIQASENLSDAYKKLGLGYKEVKSARVKTGKKKKKQRT